MLIGILGAQFDFGKYNGEKLHYDVMWEGMQVAEAKINIAFIENDSSRIKVDVRVETVGWVKFIFDELDLIYTEFNSSSGQLNYTHRFSYWSFLGGIPEIDKTSITKTDQYMTYSFERTGQPHQEKSWKDSVVVDSNFSSVDLQDIVASGMIVRATLNDVDDYYYFNILGEINGNLVPKIFPFWIKNKEILEIDGLKHKTLKCQVRPIDTNRLLREPRVIVWVTDDPYHLALQVSVIVTVPIFGDASVTAVLNTHKSTVPYWQSNE